MMSNVIEFRVANASGRSRGPVSAPDACAEIVFFPGIRYERAIEPVDPPPAPRSSRRDRRASRRKT
jgi:hypothetical protein